MLFLRDCLNRISVTHSPVTAIVLDIDDMMLSD